MTGHEAWTTGRAREVQGGMVGLAMLALLGCAPAAMASTASLRNGTTVVYAATRPRTR